MVIGKIINKHTNQEVCKQYINKPVKEIVDNLGKQLKIVYESGSFFIHEIVISRVKDDYGFWIETTNKLWRFENQKGYKTMKVYLIETSSGSYEDYYAYIETGFFDKSKAEEYVNNYNKKLDEDREKSEICGECKQGKHQYLSHAILQCPFKIKKSNITEIEKLDGDLYFECDKSIDYYDVYERHYARIKEVEICE